MNLWDRFRDGLARTRERIGDQVGALLGVGLAWLVTRKMGWPAKPADAPASPN